MIASAEARRRYLLGALMVLGAGLFLSSGGLILRHMNDQTAGWEILIFRSLGMSGSLILLLLCLHGRKIGDGFRQLGGWGLAAAGIHAVSTISYLFALLLTTVANAMFVISTGPFFAALIGWLLLRERVQALTWAAIAAAMVGIGVMFADGFAAGQSLGLVVALISVMTFAALIVLLRRLRQIETLAILVVSGLMAAAVGWSMSGDPFAIGRHDMLLALFMGVVQTGIGFGLIALGTRRIPAAEASLLLLSEPILSPLWVWIFVAERPSGAALIGGAIVLAAVTAQAIAGVIWERRRGASEGA